MNLKFDIGENRHVKLLIHSIKKEEFVINHASFELTKYGDCEPEAEGMCAIYDHVIDTVISPKKRGAYKLKITYHIADEILIEILTVMVI